MYLQNVFPNHVSNIYVVSGFGIKWSKNGWYATKPNYCLQSDL